jgi:hypothetical protein
MVASAMLGHFGSVVMAGQSRSMPKATTTASTVGKWRLP